MSGAISASTIAAIAAAGVGAIGTGFAIKQGLDASGQQQDALKKQNTAQQQAESAALSGQRKSEVAQGAANMQSPDVSTILARAAASGKGLGGTMLTGASGVDPSSLNLGKTTLLGA